MIASIAVHIIKTPTGDAEAEEPRQASSAASVLHNVRNALRKMCPTNNAPALTNKGIMTLSANVSDIRPQEVHVATLDVPTHIDARCLKKAVWAAIEEGDDCMHTVCITLRTPYTVAHLCPAEAFRRHVAY